MKESRKQYNIDYIRKNIRQFNIRFNRLFPEDQEIIDYIEAKPNMNEYFRHLVEEDMKKHPGT